MGIEPLDHLSFVNNLINQMSRPNVSKLCSSRIVLQCLSEFRDSTRVHSDKFL
jgi:hypothetical protein